MVNVKLIVCGYHRKYSINHVKWKDLPTVAERLIGFLEGHIGEFSRDTDYDEEYTIAYRSNLPEDTNENAILYALDEVVDCFLNPELGIRVARYQDSSYAGCQWWHIKQNSYISTQMFFSALQGKEAYNLPDLKSERCPDCDCSWDDPNANNRDQEIRLFENKTSYEKSWYRYRDILEGRMDYIDGELITLDNGNQDGDDDAGYGSDGNIDQDHGDIESRIKSMIMEEGVDDEEIEDTPLPFLLRCNRHLIRMLLTNIQMEFGVELDPRRLIKFDTVEDLAGYIRQLPNNTNSDYEDSDSD